jgi:hypothetical protein
MASAARPFIQGSSHSPVAQVDPHGGVRLSTLLNHSHRVRKAMFMRCRSCSPKPPRLLGWQKPPCNHTASTFGLIDACPQKTST